MFLLFFYFFCPLFLSSRYVFLYFWPSTMQRFLSFVRRKQRLLQNRKAALVVAIVNIPLSIALWVASGATPTQWLLAAIWWWSFAAVFWSSVHNIFWPAGALTAILLSFTLAGEGNSLFLPLIAIITWFFLLLIYALKLAKYVTLIPAPGLYWFLFAVWLTIFSWQLAPGFGIILPAQEKIYETIVYFFLNLWSLHLPSLLLFLWSLGFLFLRKKKFPSIPGAIIIAVLGIVYWLCIPLWLPDVLILQDKYPNLSFSLVETWFWTNISSIPRKLREKMIMTGLIITIITVLETNISGKIAQIKTKKPFNKDREIFGNAIANIASGSLGWLPVTAVLVRTALNFSNGWSSRVAALLAAGGTLCIIAGGSGIVRMLNSLFGEILPLSNIFFSLPIPIIAAILVFIAIGIMDVKHIVSFYRFKPLSFRLTIITILLSIFFDTIIGILIGNLFSLLSFIKRSTQPNIRITLFRDKSFYGKMDLSEYISIQKDHDIVFVKLQGEVNYLNIDAELGSIEKIIKNKTIVLSCSQLVDLDIDGISLVRELLDRYHEKTCNLYMTGVSQWFSKMFRKIPWFKKFSQHKRVFPGNTELLDHIIHVKIFAV